MIVTIDRIEKLLQGKSEYDVRSYSGRGMVGRSCLAIETDGSPYHLLMELAFALALEEGDDQEELMTEMAEDVRLDQIGMGRIVYFPNIEVEK